MPQLSTQSSVGQFVVDRPSRGRILESLQIDYCCGGKRPLAEVCQEMGLDPDDVYRRLLEVEPEPSEAHKAWDRASLADLCNHIERTHHASLRDELPRLTVLTEKVARAHGQRRPELIELANVFASFRSEIEPHMIKEEQILFPMIRRREANQSNAQSNHPSVGSAICELEKEHDAAGRALERMSELTAGFAPPDDACNTYRVMLDALAQLQRDTHQHVHKENNILFPRALELEAAPAG